jgi:CRP-like cAMP-binding protein
VKLRYVGNAPFFSALSETEQERVSERMHLEHRRSGEVLFNLGDESTALYLVKAGWVRLSAEGGTALASQGPGSLVGETDLFLERPRSLGATTATDVDLWVLTREDLAELIAENPLTGLTLAVSFGARLPLVDQYLVEHRLKAIPFLSSLPEDALVALSRHLTTVQKKQDEIIIERGQQPEALFIVESGQVHLHSSEEGGDFSALGAGETFGEMALMTGNPHARTAQAASDIVLWALPAAEFEELADERPDVRLALSTNLREPLQAQDMSRASERLAAMPLFTGLSEEALYALAERMLLCHVPAGEDVFAEGAPGDALYVIDTGQVEILSRGQVGETTLSRLGPDEFFGEMALLTGKPRSSSAVAATHTNLWILYRSDFEDLVNRHPAISMALSRALSERLAEMDRRFAESHLRGVKMLSGLSSSQLEDVSTRLQPARFRQGEILVQEGAPGSEMYFIESGRVELVRGTGPSAIKLAELGAGDVVGEMALLSEEPGNATVTALSDVNLWVLSKADFDDLVTAYPSLALALSRLLSERLRATDERLAQQSSAPSAVAAAVPVAAPVPVAAVPVSTAVTMAVAQPKPKAKAKPVSTAARRLPVQSVLAQVSDGLGSAADWFGSLSPGAKMRLVLITVLLVWLTCIAIPAMLISTLAAENVTNLQGAVAFVQINTPPSSESQQLVEAQATQGAPSSEPVQAEAQVLGVQAPAPPSQEAPAAGELASAAVPAPTEGTESTAPQPEGVGSDAPPSEAAPPVPGQPLPPAPSATPWVLVVTNTPLPATDTPVPPTATPVPPTPKPQAAAAARSLAAPAPTATPAVRAQPPRRLDPRLGSLNVNIHEPSGLQPGQAYWRLVECRWQNKEESGNDHTIYVEVLDEGGSRIVGQPVEIRWADGSLTVHIEDKPPPVFGTNFPMYGTLGAYSVSVPGLPSDTAQGLGMGTPDQPAFTIHTNFFLTFQRVRY